MQKKKPFHHATNSPPALLLFASSPFQSLSTNGFIRHTPQPHSVPAIDAAPRTSFQHSAQKNRSLRVAPFHAPPHSPRLLSACVFPACRATLLARKRPFIQSSFIRTKKEGASFERSALWLKLFYFAKSTARVSRMTLTLICPGYSISCSMRLAISFAMTVVPMSVTSSGFTMMRTSRPDWMA